MSANPLAPLPEPDAASASLPEPENPAGLPLTSLSEPDAAPAYLPARMVNEFVYCPRLFFYEWVDGVFAHNAETLDGAAQHRRVDREGAGLPKPDELGAECLHTRSVSLSDDALRVTAKLDLIEASGGIVTPVDYKRGRPREEDGGIGMWAPDRVQLGVQALVLRAHGYRSEQGVIYYQATRQRVAVPFDDAVMEETRAAIAGAWQLALHGHRPPPLEGSPKCAGCSLAPICLPDEAGALASRDEPPSDQLLLFHAGEADAPRKPPLSEVRRLVTPRDERRPAYLNTQGLRVGRSRPLLHPKPVGL